MSKGERANGERAGVWEAAERAAGGPSVGMSVAVEWSDAGDVIGCGKADQRAASTFPRLSMSSAEQKLRRNLGMYAQGILTRVELVNSFLFDATSCSDADEVVRLYDLLPEETREGLLSLLSDIQASGREWHPLVLDRSSSWDESEFQSNVKRIVELLLPPRGPSSAPRTSG